jgi:hypothetical protein
MWRWSIKQNQHQKIIWHTQKAYNLLEQNNNMKMWQHVYIYLSAGVFFPKVMYQYQYAFLNSTGRRRGGEAHARARGYVVVEEELATGSLLLQVPCALHSFFNAPARIPVHTHFHHGSPPVSLLCGIKPPYALLTVSRLLLHTLLERVLCGTCNVKNSLVAEKSLPLKNVHLTSHTTDCCPKNRPPYYNIMMICAMSECEFFICSCWNDVAFWSLLVGGWVSRSRTTKKPPLWERVRTKHKKGNTSNFYSSSNIELRKQSNSTCKQDQPSTTVKMTMTTTLRPMLPRNTSLLSLRSFSKRPTQISSSNIKMMIVAPTTTRYYQQWQWWSYNHHKY